MALVRLGLRPNHISLISVGFSALAAASLFRAPHIPWLFLVAAACIQVRLLCNLLDGVMAVEGGLKSKVGDLYNDIPDRFADVMILVGAGFAVCRPGLGWIAAILALMTAYLRLLGGALGLPQDFSGPCAKQQRMFWMTVGALGGFIEATLPHHRFPFALKIALCWVVIGTAYTCFRRIQRLAESLNAR
jgi:phosphatidylglycerophosphate synthase